MTCEKGNTFETSLGAMWVSKSNLPHDQAEECCRSEGGSLASLTTDDVVREMSKEIIDLNPNWKNKLFRIGVNVTNGVGRWNNGKNFKCEFCYLKFSWKKWHKKLFISILSVFTVLCYCFKMKMLPKTPLFFQITRLVVGVFKHKRYIKLSS